ncbi:isoflavone reductase family protein [Penicillium nucicola]|uniref:isoflavone reductase family protein n=1 Tax=Penicillium nucicola TaxID=1850975 RepID=UPI002544F280|nr:isoflavone reductase family protein [Penicillium nucicola]KAJ5757268.1 isoflavone reductase family protein [Penicillium nucicola]
MTRILIIGAGELGSQVLQSLIQHPFSHNATVSVLLRSQTIESTDPVKQRDVHSLQEIGVKVVPGDIVHDQESTLVSIFANHDTIIGCTGFVSGKGTQVKIASAVLAAKTARYIPWQFGVDYDIIGRGSAQDLFDEQLDVRDMLRAQQTTRWAIISTGMFTSFLFSPSFGVVDFDHATIRALGGWENRVTITTPEDIGRFTAEIVLGKDSEALISDQVIFVGGDTIAYGELAQLVERLARKPFEKKVLLVSDAQTALAEDPSNGLLKYQVVFGQGRGVAWDLKETWNFQQNLTAQTAETWAKENIL